MESSFRLLQKITKVQTEKSVSWIWQNSDTLNLPVNRFIFVRMRWNCLVLGILIFLNLELFGKLSRPSPHTSYINVQHKRIQDCDGKDGDSKPPGDSWPTCGISEFQTVPKPRILKPGSSMFVSFDLSETWWCSGLCSGRPHNSLHFLSLQKYRIWPLQYSRMPSSVKPFHTNTLKSGVWESWLLKTWDFFFLNEQVLPWFYIIHRLCVYLSLYVLVRTLLGNNYKM